MAALKWVVHSACHVLGYPSKEGHQNQANGDMKSSLKLEQATNNVGTNLTYVNNSNNISDNQVSGGFQMPLHYPRYTKADYEKMEGWKLDLLLSQYGLTFKGSLDDKREYAKGAFLWPDQY